MKQPTVNAAVFNLTILIYGKIYRTCKFYVDYMVFFLNPNKCVNVHFVWANRVFKLFTVKDNHLLMTLFSFEFQQSCAI